MSALETTLAAARLGLPGAGEGHEVEVSGADPVFPTTFPIGEAAAAALAGGGVAAARLMSLRGAGAQQVQVDVRAAAATLVGFVLQSYVDPEKQAAAVARLVREQHPTTAIHPTADDRFIHLHGGFPHLAEGTLALLGCEDDVDSVPSAVAGWKAADLEEALAAQGLCGAVVRSPDEWASHPQGRAIAPLAAIEIDRIGDAPPEPLPGGTRPLTGVRCLDLTRVLAGPTVGRTLAQYGADVLRIASPKLPFIEPFVMETGHGKRAAHLDLNVEAERARLFALLRDADVLSDGYRNGGLAGKGLSAEALAERRPGIVVVSLSCYGDVGPWAERRGWEQLAQSASGIAHCVGGADSPRILPAAATDFTTGYLGAWGAMEALHRRATEGGSWRVRVSLCQTAAWLLRLGECREAGEATGFGDLAGLLQESETPYGRLRHLSPAVTMSGGEVAWDRPTVPLGHDAPEWLPRG